MKIIRYLFEDIILMVDGKQKQKSVGMDWMWV